MTAERTHAEITTAIEPQPVIHHATEREYFDAVGSLFTSAASLAQARRRFRAFVEQYPTFNDWLNLPLEQRLGRLRGEGRKPSTMTNSIAYQARTYITYMAVTGRARLPWDYLLMIELRQVGELAGLAGHPWFSPYLESLVDQAVEQQWSRSSALQSVGFVLPRFALRHGDPTVVHRIKSDDFARLRGEIADTYATVDPRCNTKWKEEERRLGRGALSAAFGCWAIHHAVGLVLDGPKQTRQGDWRAIRPDGPPSILESIEIWQAWDKARGTQPGTLANHDLNLRYFLTYLAEEHSDLERIEDLKRHHVVGFMSWLKQRKTLRGDGLLTAGTRNGALATLAAMLRDLRDEELTNAPTRTLVHRNDFARTPKPLPRNIPKREFGLVVESMRRIENPYQRCALLVARWSGARRDEIRRLEVDCLDTYDDGTYRLRIPAGKTGEERSIPLADEAAEAIQVVQALRAADHDQGIIDKRLERRVRFLFYRQGRRLSTTFLFDNSLKEVCEAAGLIQVNGRGNVVTAHRFRHTLGTDLVEQGARWRTIMAILGHKTADMTLTYAQVSDPEVKADYEKVVSKSTAIAGPAADSILANRLPQRELEWLKSNFLKTELELGACVRLPEEGPCECELFFVCSKFFTTKEHVPRLRRRWEREQWLIEDAQVRGWPREVERHRATQRRIENLLQDLAEDPPSM